MPSPTETELRIQDSPVPTQTVFGLEGSIVTAPMDRTGCLTKTSLHRVPQSSDFQTPPLAAPTKTVVLPSTLRAATAATRPLMTAEPMLRAERPERTPESKAGPRVPGGAGGFAGATGDADAAEGAAGMARPIGVPAGGNLKSPSSTSTFASARSIVTRDPRGSPLRPGSIEKGNQIPPTCS